MNESFEIPDGMTTLTEPDVWLACDCGKACVFERALSFSQGWIWVWRNDCKHLKREPHDHVLMTKDGPIPMGDE